MPNLKCAKRFLPDTLPRLALLAFILFICLHWLGLPHIASVSIGGINQINSQSVQLPDMRGSAEESGYEISLEYHYPQQTWLEIMTKGIAYHILVNGYEVKVPKTKPSYWNTGQLNLAPYLLPGMNTIQIYNSERGMAIGLPVFHSNSWQLSDLFGVALLATLACMVALVVQRCGTGWFCGSLLACAFVLFVFFMTRTGFKWHTMDMPSHVMYMLHVARELAWPAPYAGWQYYHPPLYYTIQAGIVLIGNVLRSFDVLTMMRCFSIACFMTFLGIGCVLLRWLVASNLAYAAVLPLLVFYPAGIMYAPRLDSNLLFYVLYSACLLLTLRWLEYPSAKKLGLILICLGLSFATRSNTLIFLPLLGLAGVYAGRMHGRKAYQLRSVWVAIGIISLGLGLAADFGRSAYYNYIEHADMPYLVGNVNLLMDGLGIRNDAVNYLTFDWKTYFGLPFWSPHDDASGRQNFWTSMLKSSLYGEFGWRAPWLAVYMKSLLLAIIVYALGCSAWLWRSLSRRTEWWMAFLSLAIPVAALMLNRWVHPFASSQDFRYIYPALISLCAVLGIVIQAWQQRENRYMAILGCVLPVAMAGVSVTFWLCQ